MSTDQVVDGPPSTSQLLPGMQIGRYVLGKKLGRGGFGVVFRAHDTSLDREVALKFLHAEHTATPQMLGRFLQEARSAAKIAHGGIVTVFECGQITGGGPADGTAFIAMELLQGESLTDRLARSGRLDPATAMEITRQVASALEAAHRAGIVHRDLKPDNIFLIPDSAVQSGERVKVLDFGIAKLGAASGRGVETQSMVVFGTPKYMSPEQCRSAASVDHRSDIYTLGCILFELVTGKGPFAGAAGELIAQHVLIEAPRADAIEPTVPAELADLIAELLAKEPDKRPQTMAAVQRALEKAGAWAPGVAPTLLPDAIASARFMVPVSLQTPPSGRVRALGTSNPTTLHAATGVSVVQPAPAKKRLVPYMIGAGALGMIVAVALIVRSRASDDDSKVPPLPSVFVDRPKMPPSPVETPKPAPPPPTKVDPPPAPKQVPSKPAAPAYVPKAIPQKVVPKVAPKAAPEIEMPPDPRPEPKIDPKLDPKTDPKLDPNPKTDPKLAPKTDPKLAPKIDPKLAPKIEPKIDPKTPPKRDKTINPFAKSGAK